MDDNGVPESDAEHGGVSRNVWITRIMQKPGEDTDCTGVREVLWSAAEYAESYGVPWSAVEQTECHGACGIHGAP